MRRRKRKIFLLNNASNYKLWKKSALILMIRLIILKMLASLSKIFAITLTLHSDERNAKINDYDWTCGSRTSASIRIIEIGQKAQ
jgi:hypothetical protein